MKCPKWGEPLESIKFGGLFLDAGELTVLKLKSLGDYVRDFLVRLGL